ncbi:hypothetical protein RIF29_00357 [Crotalaria pallida]|uniref:F-box domain-containing protein n=1 Tax=Crotalaria pallida TaxID=3830 RepID=A0AAN9IW38_CROPI
MDDMEEREETLDNESKGKQNMLIGKDEELSRIREWTHLPSDILEMIMKRLKLMDYLAISGVCSPWRATINQAIANKHCHPLPELPFVFLRSQRKCVLPDMFFSVDTEQVYSLKSKNNTLPKRGHLCHGIIEGWMILSEKRTDDTNVISFLNPVSNDVVMVPSPLSLPSQSPIHDRSDLYVGKMVASSSPKCEDCVVVGRFSDYAHIAYFRVNSDKSWTMIEASKEDTGYFYDMEIFDGKLYVRTDKLSSAMLVYDLQDSIEEPPKPKVLGMIPRWPQPERSVHDNLIHAKGIIYAYLTRDYASGELLLIFLFSNSVYEAGNVDFMKVIRQYVSPHQITKCEVFKLDSSNDNKWVKLHHLDDRVIFLGNYKSFVMSREALNNTTGGELITKDSVYFALHYACPAKPWLGTQLGRICLTDNSIKYFSLEQFGQEMDFYPYWFLPSAW